MLRSKNLIGLLSVATFALALGCGQSQPKFAITHVEKRARLDNGLRMVIMPDKTTPLVQVDVRYEVGSKEDPPGKAGLAHLVEHMMFQHRFGDEKVDIHKRPPTFQVLPQVTVGFNAYTNWDTTHYYLTAPKEDVGTLLRIEAARMATGCKTIPPEEFEREKEVVRNEIRLRTGNAEGQQLQAILDTAYPEGHAYRRMIGGNDAQLAGIQMQDVCKFMKDYYLPSRATVIVTGNVDSQKAGEMIKYDFGAIPKGNPAPLKTVEPVKLKYVKREVQLDIERTTIHVMFALPPRTSDEAQAANLMLFVMAGNLSQFAEDWDFGQIVGVQQLGGAMAPILAVSLELRPGKSVDEALDYVWKALNVARRYTGLMLEKGSYESEKISAIHYRQNLVESLEPLAARAAYVADMVQFDKKVQFDSNQVFIYEMLDRVDRLDMSKYKEFVKKTLDKKKAVVLIAKANKEGIKGDRRAKLKFEGKSHEERPPPPVDVREAKRPLPAPKSDSILVDAERYTLPNGMRVVLLPYEGLPIVHASLMFDVGAAHEPPSKAGLSDVAASFLRLPPGDAYGKTGVSIGGNGGMDSTVFTGRGINIYLEVILKGLERNIKAGQISQERIESYQEDYRRQFKRESFQRNWTYSMELAGALYGTNHPYVTNGSPTPKTLGKVGRDAAMNFVRKHYTAKNATLILTGNYDKAEAKRFIKDIFGGWSGGHKDEPVTVKAAERSGPEYIGVIGKDTEPTARITIAYPGPAGIDGQQAARMVLSEMLNQRMSTVRTQLGSTYGAYAGRSTRKGPTSYQMGGLVDVARLGESLKFMREQVAGLRSGDKEFDRDFVVARRIVLKNLLAVSTESYTLARRLRGIAEYNLEPDYYEKLQRYVAAVSPAQIKAMLETELDPQKEIVVVLAGRDAMDKAFGEAGIDNVRFVEPKK